MDAAKAAAVAEIVAWIRAVIARVHDGTVTQNEFCKLNRILNDFAEDICNMYTTRVFCADRIDALRFESLPRDLKHRLHKEITEKLFQAIDDKFPYDFEADVGIEDVQVLEGKRAEYIQKITEIKKVFSAEVTPKVLKKLLKNHFQSIRTFTRARGVADDVQTVPGLGLGLNSLVLDLGREVIFWARDTCGLTRLAFDRQMHECFLTAMTTMERSHQDPRVNFILQQISTLESVSLGYALYDAVPVTFDWGQFRHEAFFAICAAVAREIVPDLRALLRVRPGMPPHPEITLEVVDQIMPENEVWPTFVPRWVRDYILHLHETEIIDAIGA